MPRPRRTTDRSSCRLSFHVTPGERDVIARMARRNKQRLHEFLRDLVLADAHDLDDEARKVAANPRAGLTMDAPATTR